jgi:Uma2 family endonuclease
MTVDEFLKLPGIEELRVELINGSVVDKDNGGLIHELVKANLIQILVVWMNQHRIGIVFAGTSYRVDEHNCMIPDLSVLSNERVPVPATNDLPRGAPDLAIEVVSSETADRLLGKIQTYLKHGTKAVWVVFPERRTIQIYAAARQTMLEQDEVLDDHDALPGFSTPVSAIFKGL